MGNWCFKSIVRQATTSSATLSSKSSHTSPLTPICVVCKLPLDQIHALRNTHVHENMAYHKSPGKRDRSARSSLPSLHTNPDGEIEESEPAPEFASSIQSSSSYVTVLAMTEPTDNNNVAPILVDTNNNYDDAIIRLPLCSECHVRPVGFSTRKNQMYQWCSLCHENAVKLTRDTDGTFDYSASNIDDDMRQRVFHARQYLGRSKRHPLTPKSPITIATQTTY